jgi:poly(A) RNA polymerase, mitochondrial
MFPFIEAHPFGSSVNGFGKIGCDLDLIVRLNRENQQPASRLIFHTKANLLNERSQTQRQMEAIGDILYLFLPGVSSVRRILQARVPIIKFNHECLGLEVDLSMSNMTGVYMSELLYLFGEIDDRVRPLTFCVRKWASAVGLTNPSPGRWISNFSLTLLVIFFLQQLKKPILPPLNVLVKSARKSDIRIADESINCTFLRDLDYLKFQRLNEDKLSILLIQFFEFFSKFEFNVSSVSILEGKCCGKADHSAMFIVNPFEPLTNVSKNVSLEEVERFKFEVRNAAWILEQSQEEEKDPKMWGILKLFKTNKNSLIKPQMFFKSRLVDVSELFSADEQQTSSVNYKNNGSRKEITSIRQATKKEIEKVKLKFKRR